MTTPMFMGFTQVRKDFKITHNSYKKASNGRNCGVQH
jgi:hypothetical protein